MHKNVCRVLSFHWPKGFCEKVVSLIFVFWEKREIFQNSQPVWKTFVWSSCTCLALLRQRGVWRLWNKHFHGQCFLKHTCKFFFEFFIFHSSTIQRDACSFKLAHQPTRQLTVSVIRKQLGEQWVRQFSCRRESAASRNLSLIQLYFVTLKKENQNLPIDVRSIVSHFVVCFFDGFSVHIGSHWWGDRFSATKLLETVNSKLVFSKHNWRAVRLSYFSCFRTRKWSAVLLCWERYAHLQFLTSACDIQTDDDNVLKFVTDQALVIGCGHWHVCRKRKKSVLR